MGLAAIALTACGGSDSTTPPSSSSPAASSTTSTTTFGAAGNARLKVEAQLRRYLRQQQHLSRARVDCVIRRLRRTVSAGQIEELAGGRASPPVTRAVARAGGACALASP